MIRVIPSLLLFAALGPAIGFAGPDGSLVWDSLEKEYHARPGETKADFVFTVRNPSAVDATVTSVETSCGCTAAGFPAMPWTIPAGSASPLHATVDFHGKWGEIVKTITVDSSAGRTTLTVKVDSGEAMRKVEAKPLLIRAENIQIASADRQSVFTHADCAACHAVPLAGKVGKPLFRAACGICHDSPHRASMVPDLHTFTAVADPAFWRARIAHGKDGSLMPGFAAAEHGPLDERQIDSLVEYLTQTFGHRAAGAESTDTGSGGNPL